MPPHNQAWRRTARTHSMACGMAGGSLSRGACNVMSDMRSSAGWIQQRHHPDALAGSRLRVVQRTKMLPRAT
jgi:hypothetical protein